MAGEVNRMWGLVFVLVLVFNVCTSVIAQRQGGPQVPCYFIFGDSLVDNGNNNQIMSRAKADFLPYGIDFPDGPTGRFSNGLTTVDVISQLLGFANFIPPYTQARGRALLGGVNYASGGGGIRDESGQQLGQRISFNGQLRNYQTTVQQIVNILGDENTTADYLRSCIYTVAMGSNDYLNNYFMPQRYSSSRRYTPVQYADVLIQQYTQQLRSLYNYGARKVAVLGISQIGCIPKSLEKSPDGVQCVERINSANRLFNDRLQTLVDNINNNLPDAKFTYINSYGIFDDLLRNPAFTVKNRGCCGVGRNNGQSTCVPGENPCKNRNQHVFWDAFHPTEAASIFLGKRAYNAQSPADARPYDMLRLAQL